MSNIDTATDTKTSHCKNWLNFYKCPPALLVFILGTSIFALSAALIGQYMFGLEPCTLCLYQRVPFIAAIIFALIGLALKRSQPNVTTTTIALSGLAYGINTGIAAYHTGVEQKWWASAVEGCKIDFSGATDSRSFLENIMSAPGTPCDVIPWQDPLLGLSMANYNIALGAFVAGLCVVHFVFRKA